MGFRHLSVLFFLLVSLPFFLHAAPLKVHFIDVGQGDAIFIQGMGGKNMLIDAGDDGDDAGEKILTYLSSIGVNRINTFLLTHPHDDHYGGIFAMIGQVTIDKFLYGTHVNGKKYSKMVKKVKAAGIPYRHVSAGHRFDLGSGVSALAIHSGPPEMRGIVSTVDVDRDDDGRGPDLNRCSVVLRLSYGQSSYLLTGDATKHVEKDLLADGINVSATVYKAAHHGSRYSNTAEFLAAVNPRWGVIQVGAGNHHGHPHAPALSRMEAVCEQVYRNDTGGTIYSYADGATLVINERPYPLVEERPLDDLPLVGHRQSDFAFSELFTDPPSPALNEQAEITFSVSSKVDERLHGLRFELYDKYISEDTKVGTLDSVNLPPNALADLRLPWQPHNGGKRRLYVLVKDDQGKLLATHAYSVSTSRRKIVVDKDHGNYGVVRHQLSAFLTDLKRLGYEVELCRSEISAEVLQGASALLLLGPNAPYTGAEISSIADFLQGGGGVAVTSMGRSANRSVNYLLQELQTSIQVQDSLARQSSNYFALKRDWFGKPLPATMYLPNVAKLTLAQDEKTVVLAEVNKEPILAAQQIGSGRLIVGGGPLFGNGSYRNYRQGHDSQETNSKLVNWLSGRFHKEKGHRKSQQRKLNWSRTVR